MDGFTADLLAELSGKRPRVEILGIEQVLVENHRGILEYDDGVIRVRCAGCEVRIIGSNLQLVTLSAEELAVRGTIASVEYLSCR